MDGQICSPAMNKYAKLIFDDLSASESSVDTFCKTQGLSRSEFEALQLKDTGKGVGNFLQYLASAAGNAIAPLHSDVGYPISDYFISSSHNTYLLGHQLYGHATSKAYQIVLERGCRCVEIDVWDGDDVSSSDSESSTSSDSDSEDDSAKASSLRGLTGRFKKEIKVSKSKVKNRVSKDGITRVNKFKRSSVGKVDAKREPRVLHGFTATREVSFREVCNTIRDSAFNTSEFPLIVSLEVHTCPQQQEMMVDIMKEAWGQYLLEENVKINANTALPALGDLMKRILIKVKYSSPESAKSNTKRTTEGETAIVGESSDEGEGTEAIKKGLIIPALGSMGVYTRSCHFRGFDQAEATSPCHIFSLSETKLKQMYKENALALFRHNKKYMMRAYPKSSRIASSNLDPLPFWRNGVQFVALNWQHVNAAMMLNHAMFDMTGGWTLKPEGYRSSHTATSPQVALDRGTLDLSVEFLSGAGIECPGESLRLYVKVELHVEDIEEDGTEDLSEVEEKEGQFKARTKTTRGEGNPDFERQTIRFQGVPDVTEELTFLRLKVMDDDRFRPDSVIAWACFRLDRLRMGLRLVHLFGPDGGPTNGSLLVRIEKRITST